MKKISVYKDLEQGYFQNPQELSLEKKFQDLTRIKGISYETDWLAWCDKAMQLLD